MTDSVWTAVPQEPEERPAEERVVDATWDVDRPDTLVTATSADERAVEAAKERAREYHVHARVLGAWAPREDLSQWAEPYRRAFTDELERLRAEDRERREQASSG